MANDIDLKVKAFQTYPRASGIAGDEISLGASSASVPVCKYPLLKYRDPVINTEYFRTFQSVTGVRSIKDKSFGRNALVLRYQDSYYEYLRASPEHIKRFFGLLKFVPLPGAQTFEACGGDTGNWHLLPFANYTYDDYLIARTYTGTSPIDYGFLPHARLLPPPNYASSFLLPELKPTETSQELHDNFHLYMVFLHLSTLNIGVNTYANLRFDIALYMRYTSYPGVGEFVPLASIAPQWTISADIFAISGAYTFSVATNGGSSFEIFPLFRTNTYLWGYNAIWFDNIKSYFGVIRLN